MSGYEYNKGYGGERGEAGYQETTGGMEGLMEKIPGTEAHRATHTTKIAGDPVYGTTGEHSTAMGAKAESAWHEAKAAMPGTDEYRMTHTTGQGVTPMGDVQDRGARRYEGIRDEADRAAMRFGEERGVHGDEAAYAPTSQPAYGGTNLGATHDTTRADMGAEQEDKGTFGSMMEKVKAAIPGTEEHKEKKMEQRMQKGDW